jgi:hypothetical protein
VVVRRTTEWLEVTNDRRPKLSPAPPGGVGLANLAERTRRLTGRALEVRDEGHRFVVVVPLLTGEAAP